MTVKDLAVCGGESKGSKCGCKQVYTLHTDNTPSDLVLLKKSRVSLVDQLISREVSPALQPPCAVHQAESENSYVLKMVEELKIS